MPSVRRGPRTALHPHDAVPPPTDTAQLVRLGCDTAGISAGRGCVELQATATITAAIATAAAGSAGAAAMMRRTALVLLISLGRRGGDADAQVTTCRFTNDGDCDVDRGTCVAGSDCADCPNDVECGASAGMAPEGENTCTWANDDTCDFPTHCAAGTDCDDCPGDVACAHGGQQGQPPPPSGPVGECGEVCDDSWCTSEYTDTAPRSNTIFYDGHDCYAGAPSSPSHDSLRRPPLASRSRALANQPLSPLVRQRRSLLGQRLRGSYLRRGLLLFGRSAQVRRAHVEPDC
jgi:hypothetical protein